MERKQNRSLRDRRRVQELLERMANGSDLSDLSDIESDDEDVWKPPNEGK